MQMKPSILLSALAVVAMTLSAEASPERIKIPGSGVTLAGVLYKPEGSGPFPAVVALHGCNGLFNRDGQTAPREAAWADKLVQEGFAVLLPDSFGPRGLGPQCRTRDRKARASVERREDAHAARRWLQEQPFIKPKAISLMGWSNGGTATLYAIRQERQSRPGRGFRVVGTDFAAAVAFYPGCLALSDKAYRTRIPTTILSGELDDWTPPKPCEALVARAKSSNSPVSITIYPGAYHDFDWPDRPVAIVRGLLLSGRNEAHAGTNPAARADVLKKVPALLAR